MPMVAATQPTPAMPSAPGSAPNGPVPPTASYPRPSLPVAQVAPPTGNVFYGRTTVAPPPAAPRIPQAYSQPAALVAMASTGGGSETVLLNFSADWCGPCRLMNPTVEQLAARGYPVRRTNVDQYHDLAQRFGITTIPCFVMIVNGKEAGRVVGATSLGRLEQLCSLGVAAPQAAERRGKPLDANDIRVFATIENNVASNLLNLQGVGVAQGLTDKGYIYTDRPAYRAGQLVNVRGCLRRAAANAYVIDKDKPYTVEVFDARNRPIRQEKVKLNAFGSFHVHFVLPPNSPQGQYRVLVHDNGTQNFQGTFLVHEYQLEPIRLVVDTRAPGTPGRRVYYRGEPIEGTIRAEFYYGAPVVGREIRYQLAGDRMQNGHHRRQGRGQDQSADPRV